MDINVRVFIMNDKIRRKVIQFQPYGSSEPIKVLVEELSRNNGKAIVKFTLLPDLESEDEAEDETNSE